MRWGINIGGLLWPVSIATPILSALLFFSGVIAADTNGDESASARRDLHVIGVAWVMMLMVELFLCGAYPG